jgi:predicted O-methyltransferase YrrM
MKRGLNEFLNGKSGWTADGWCDDFPEQLELFDKIFSENKFQNILEVGFNAGHSAEYFLTYGTEFDVYSFDLGEYSACPLGKEYIDKTFPGRHHLILGDSRKTLPEFVRNTELKFDFIFIDGGHQYWVAKSDIWYCRSLAHEKTILVMDDVRYDTRYQRRHTIGATRAWSESINGGYVEESGNDFGMNHRNKPTRGFAWGKYNFETCTKPYLR